MTTKAATARKWHATVAIVALLCGLLFYAFARSSNLLPDLPSSMASSFPSFIHMLALTSLAFAIGRGFNDITIRLTGSVLLLTLAGECLIGYFNATDLLAAIIGTMTGIVFGLSIESLHGATRHGATHVEQNSVMTSGFKPDRKSSSLALIGLSMTMITGSYYGSIYDDGDYSETTPVYLSYANLRSSVAVTGATELEGIGRVYLFGDYVFLNRRNEGIHVIDNSDPRNPVNLRFITIPGNTELSIRSGFLYADSYVDLVTLDIRDINNIQEINRQTDIFPWDAYQNVPDNIYFSSSSLDSTRGVVTSYVR